MPNVWIHRPKSTDIIVHVSGYNEALAFTKNLLSSIDKNYNIYDFSLEDYKKTGTQDIGDINSLQVSFISNNYEPNEGWDYWNPMGYIYASKEDAYLMGDSLEPNEIPQKSSSIQHLSSMLYSLFINNK